MRARLAVLLLPLVAWLPQRAAGQEEAAESPSILTTILLPTVAEILRDRGIPPEDVEAAVIGARERGMPPSGTYEVLRETARMVDQHGPIENFGAFVQAQLDAGLRGRDLAAAIRAEHARRGIGKGRRLTPRGGPPVTPASPDRPGADELHRPPGAEPADTGRRPRTMDAGQRGRPPDSTPSTVGRRRPDDPGGAR